MKIVIFLVVAVFLGPVTATFKTANRATCTVRHGGCFVNGTCYQGPSITFGHKRCPGGCFFNNTCHYPYVHTPETVHCLLSGGCYANGTCHSPVRFDNWKPITIAPMCIGGCFDLNGSPPECVYHDPFHPPLITNDATAAYAGIAFFLVWSMLLCIIL